MWLSILLPNPLAQDAAATAITFSVSLLWLRLVDWLVARGLLAQKLSRKIIHIGTGPPYILCWNLFSSAPYAAWLAALVPLAITAQFTLVGLGWLQDDAAVRAITRTGNRREMLRGPLLYGLTFVVCTVVFWRHSPLGILALMLLCGGDGLADIAGRRWGTTRLPFNAVVLFLVQFLCCSSPRWATTCLQMHCRTACWLWPQWHWLPHLWRRCPCRMWTT